MAEKLNKSSFVFIGGTYVSPSRTFDAQRSINLYPEVSGAGPGKNGEVAMLLSADGCRQVQTIGTGPIRGAYTISNAQRTFIVSGNELYVLTSAQGIPVACTGNLNTSAGPVSMVDNGQFLLIVDGANGYWVSLSGSPAVNVINDPHFYNGARTCTYQGGYFICEQAGTSNFFVSGIDADLSLPPSTSASTAPWPPLNISSADSSPDILVAVISNNQQLYLLGARTIEVWSLEGGSASSPFSPIPGRTINIGCISPATVTRLAGTFFWLGANDQGGGIVYSMENDTPTRVSNHAIEAKIQALGDLSSSTALAWQKNGHQFVALNCPGAATTYTYDMTTKMWCERQTLTAGVMDRFLGQCHAFLNGQHLIGDYRNGNLYVLDQSYYQDGTEPLRRVRVTPHSSEGVAMVFYQTLQIDMQPGTGTLTTNPRLVLEISRDGGFTWGNPIYATAGLIGAYTWRARWQRLGRGRDLVFRVSCDDPVNITYLNAFLSTESGTS